MPSTLQRLELVAGGRARARASARSPPAKTTSAPSARSASAIASAGTTWPAVPPAAITILGGPAPLGLRHATAPRAACT